MKPVVDRLETEYAARIDFVVYGDVNVNAEIGSFARQQGVTVVPTMMTVTPDGAEADRVIGSIAEADLRARLDALLGE
jgi:hypothetical protein